MYFDSGSMISKSKIDILFKSIKTNVCMCGQGFNMLSQETFETLCLLCNAYCRLATKEKAQDLEGRRGRDGF